MEAIDQLEDVGRYLFREAGPQTAGRFVARLRAAGESLADMPERGRPIRPGVRELTSVPPYLIRYRLRNDEVVITRVRHGARRPRG